MFHLYILPNIKLSYIVRLFSCKSMSKLSSYDVVGLDFDQTLIQYNLSNLFRFHFSYLTKYLVEKNGYVGLSTEMNQDDIDFIRRGLFMDFKCGNILDITLDGIIISASHGTRKLEEDEIINIYGPEKRWSATDTFIKDKLALWEGPASEETRTFLDYSDTTGTLVFAKVIDLIDGNGEKEYCNVWPHLLEAIIDMYREDSDLNKELLCNTSKYVHKCEPEVINFLNKINQSAKLLLITGSSPCLVKHIATFALGSGWEKLFDTIIYSAKKPAFFTTTPSFRKLNGEEIKLNTYKGQYLGGNWSELFTIIKNEIIRDPKCVYLGDSTIQDVYAPSVSLKPIDSISVIDEALADGNFPGEHPHGNYLRSKFWGPYFGKSDMNSVMGDIIMKYSKFCIPTISYIARRSPDYEYTPFWQNVVKV